MQIAALVAVIALAATSYAEHATAAKGASPAPASKGAEHAPASKGGHVSPAHDGPSHNGPGHCSSRPLAAVMAASKARHTSGSGTAPKVLVTGAAGFIASHVAQICQDQMGFTVIAVDDLSGGFMRNVEPWIRSPSRFVRGDVQDKAFVKQLFKDHAPFHYVYHLAAYAAEGLSHFIRQYNYGNNLEASVMLLNYALNQGAQHGQPVRRFVFTSSIAAFGAVLDPSELPMTEDTPQRPEDPYGIAKHSMELDLKAAHHMFSQNYTVFRPHNVYGPRQNIADKFRNAIGIFMNQQLHGEPMTIFGNGEQKRSFSYIDDVAPVHAYMRTYVHTRMDACGCISIRSALLVHRCSRPPCCTPRPPTRPTSWARTRSTRFTPLVTHCPQFLEERTTLFLMKSLHCVWCRSTRSPDTCQRRWARQTTRSSTSTRVRRYAS